MAAKFQVDSSILYISIHKHLLYIHM